MQTEINKEESSCETMHYVGMDTIDHNRDSGVFKPVVLEVVLPAESLGYSAERSH